MSRISSEELFNVMFPVIIFIAFCRRLWQRRRQWQAVWEKEPQTQSESGNVKITVHSCEHKFSLPYDHCCLALLLLCFKHTRWEVKCSFWIFKGNFSQPLSSLLLYLYDYFSAYDENLYYTSQCENAKVVVCTLFNFKYLYSWHFRSHELGEGTSYLLLLHISIAHTLFIDISNGHRKVYNFISFCDTLSPHFEPQFLFNKFNCVSQCKLLIVKGYTPFVKK